jgi:deoxyadenosine/deoxycytidine kinase
LFFLFQRAQQLQDLRQNDMFEPVRVADFLIDKDQLFAEQNLEPDEFELYLNVYRHLTIDAPAPDLVIYLQAPTNVLLDRIQKRAVESEQLIELTYLKNLNEAYAEFFHYYDKSPLLIVNSEDIDLAHNEDDYQQLLKRIVSAGAGTHYFNPRPSLI